MSAYVRVVRSIWTDPEWLDLTSIEKLVYLQLISQPNISKCGVLPFVPRRWAHMHPDLAPEAFVAVIDALEAKRYVLVDRDTEEILVRTYVRYDEAWRQTNGVRGIEIEAQEIMSKRLLAVVVDEYEQASGKAWRNSSVKGYANPCDNPCDNPSDNPSDNSCATPLSLIPYPLAPNPEPSAPNPNPETPVSDMASEGTGATPVEIVPDDDFAHFWAIYPRRTQKATAVKRWSNMTRKDRRAALEALPVHVERWRATGTEEQFIPHPATWLNQRRWEDEITIPTHRPNLSKAAQTIQEMMHHATDRRSQDRGLPRRAIAGVD